MASLEPGEEILPKDAAKDEPRMEEPSLLERFNPSALLWIGAGLALLVLGCKLYLRFGWILPGSPAQRLIRAARSTLSTLHDLGYRRRTGETRLEFRGRLARELGESPVEITTALTTFTYGRAVELHTGEIDSLHAHDRRVLARAPLLRRIAAFLNPSSVAAALSGGRW